MIIGNKEGRLGSRLKSKNHELVAGLSEKIGGDDEGMNPHQIIEAALTACTILTCQLYANKKEWQLTNTKVQVKITTENDSGTVIEREIVFEGDLSIEQKNRLFEIANKTPIYLLLTRPTQIVSKLL